MKWTRIALGLAAIGAAVYWGVTRPGDIDQEALAQLSGDAERGEAVFWASGCASCHAAEGASGEAKLVLAGGRAFASDFGTFYAPNISPDPTHGIGGWSTADLARAMQAGVSPEGKHYFPAFPYVAYQNATAQDVVDLKAYLDTLPSDATPSKPHDVGFPFSIRRNMGGWKFLFGSGGWVVDGDLTPEQERGRYLAEALAHCGDCHTPRNALGGIKRGAWLSGAPNPSGEGKIPNITPSALEWSELDIASYLTTGFTPEFDSAGGHMADVVENFSKLPPEDAAAVAAYLKAVAPSE